MTKLCLFRLLSAFNTQRNNKVSRINIETEHRSKAYEIKNSLVNPLSIRKDIYIYFVGLTKGLQVKTPIFAILSS